MFFRQVEMKDIEKATNITERIIRRIVLENKWIEKRERYLRFLCSYAAIHGIALYKMAQLARVLPYALGRVHRKFKTQKPQRAAPWNKRIDNKTENKFIEEYANGLTAQEIAEKHGFKTSKTVLDILEKNAIKIRAASKPTFYDKSFFEKVDSHDKAYVLGLIFTDGYIIKDYSGFGIQLTESDGYLLNRIANLIGAKQGTAKINGDTKRKSLKGARDMVRLTVHNRKMAEDLRSLGVVRNKSKILRYNNCVPSQYLSSFFRGLIDGDGCICTVNGRIQIQISSASKGFVEDVKMAVFNRFKFSIHYPKIDFYNLYLYGGA